MQIFAWHSQAFLHMCNPMHFLAFLLKFLNQKKRSNEKQNNDQIILPRLLPRIPPHPIP